MISKWTPRPLRLLTPPEINAASPERCGRAPRFNATEECVRRHRLHASADWNSASVSDGALNSATAGSYVRHSWTA